MACAPRQCQPPRFSGPTTSALPRGLVEAASAGGDEACASAKRVSSPFYTRSGLMLVCVHGNGTPSTRWCWERFPSTSWMRFVGEKP